MLFHRIDYDFTVLGESEVPVLDVASPASAFVRLVVLDNATLLLEPHFI